MVIYIKKFISELRSMCLCSLKTIGDPFSSWNSNIGGNRKFEKNPHQKNRLHVYKFKPAGEW